MADAGLQLRHFVVAGALLVAAGVVGGAVFVWSGIYNVSAARQHIDLTTWLLDAVRRQSVRTHSIGIKVPQFDREMVRLGAAHYESGCAPCHGAPGRPASAVVATMLPAPPALATSSLDWSAAELFWIVHNGQKYTGMPGWTAPEREDEVWSVVAFLQELPALDRAAYARLAGLDTGEIATGAGAPIFESAAFEDCARCHGAPGERPPTELAPQLSGQRLNYLIRALEEYASGARSSGTMQMAVAGLSAEEIENVSTRYAAAAAPIAASPEKDRAAAALGEEIAHRGVPSVGVPACFSCHNESGTRFPRLAGQSARYVAQQLRLWKEGGRVKTSHGAIMSRVARRLSENEIVAVAAYLQSLAPGEAVQVTAAAP
jgi:cytochrome c553